MYPKCAQSFKNWVTKNNNFLKVYNDLGHPRPLDITLKNKLVNLDYESQLNLYYNISFNYQPKDIETGPIISEKLFPLLKDSKKKIDSIHNIVFKNNQNNYIEIQNQEEMKRLINNKNFNYFSLNSSISNSFQLKTTNLTLEESDKNLYNILDDLQLNINREGNPFIKLYISCINECPIEGKIDNYLVVKRLRKLYNGMKINSIVLTDTCGTLNEDDFEYIVDTCSYFEIPKSVFGLQLNIKQDREKNAEKIIHKALDKKITNFDVALLDTGGNSSSLDNSHLSSNLSYELYYKFLCKYIINKS